MTKPGTCCPLSNGDAKRSVARFGRSPRTTAIPLLPPDVDEATWLAARRTRVGASEMAAILGVSPPSHQSAFSLWWSKQEGWETEQTLAMKIGHRLEPVIAELFAEGRPDLLICRSGAGMWTHHTYGWLSCTPDFLAVASNVDETGLVHIEPVECKSDEGGAGWGKPGTDEVPEHHRVQVRMQCHILGAPRGHLVRMAGKRFSSYTVEASGDLPDEWVKAARAFLTSIETGVAPDPDGSEASEDALKRLHPAIDEDTTAFVPDELAFDMDRLSNLIKVYKDELAKVKNQIRLHMGRAQYGATRQGEKVFVERQVYKRRGYEVAPTTVDQLRKKG